MTPPNSKALTAQYYKEVNADLTDADLPIYSPDLNPTEEAFSKIKESVRRACARTREALLEALGEALSAVNFRDAQGFFEHAGYHPTDQLL
jgi:transposase